MTPGAAAFRRLAAHAALASAVLPVPLQAAGAGERWRGLDVAGELTGCRIEYDRELYDYDRPTLLPVLKDRTDGAIFSPHTRPVFLHDDDVDIEHIVAAEQAHYSGLCKEDADTRLAFAADLLNLTLAAKGVNRAKTACDAATWMPPENRCWFARRVVEVRRKYKLTIDRAEADALESILSACTPDDEFMNRTVKPGPEALDRWDADGSGQISCGELQAKGLAIPIGTSHPAWPFVKHGNCDGTACPN